MAAVNSSSISLKRLKRDTDNDHYFQAYSDLGVHEDMVRDFVRTNTYRKAIEEYSKYFKNKVVLDVGAGTCILSIFCAKAGARKVYAVEASDIVYQAKKVIEENSFQHVITTFHSKIEDIILPEKVDIIVSEWMGYFLLFENMLSSVIYARDHWLQEGGIILPGQAKIHVCAISADTLLEEKLNFWDSTAKLYGVKMSSLAPQARQSFLKEVQVEQLQPEQILSFSQTVYMVDCYTATLNTIKAFRAPFCLKFIGDGKLAGLGAWFDVTFWHREFLSDETTKPLTLSTSPERSPTHWSQTLFYFDELIDVYQDETLSGELQVQLNSQKPRFVDVFILAELNNWKLEKSFTLKSFY